MPKTCGHPGCDCNALYNKVGEINPKFCPKHKTDHMINVFWSFRKTPLKRSV